MIKKLVTLARVHTHTHTDNLIEKSINIVKELCVLE